MRNLKVGIAYNGTAYHGWQRQDNGITVQQVVEESMSRILGQEVIVHGCSRTDAGVHAKEFYFTASVDNGIPCNGFIKAMNGLLPDDIAVLSCEDVPMDFHARFSAKGKEYLYLVNNSERKDVFRKGMALTYPLQLDEKLLDRAAKLFIGEHDFGAFCKAEAKEHLKSTVRTVYDFRVIRNGDDVLFYVSGNGFLHNMVRIMVGTLIYVNEGKRSESDITAAIKTGNRELAGKTVPPCGLYLNKVIY